MVKPCGIPAERKTALEALERERGNGVGFQTAGTCKACRVSRAAHPLHQVWTILEITNRVSLQRSPATVRLYV